MPIGQGVQASFGGLLFHYPGDVGGVIGDRT
jgi:hypothetical protein